MKVDCKFDVGQKVFVVDKPYLRRNAIAQPIDVSEGFIEERIIKLWRWRESGYWYCVVDSVDEDDFFLEEDIFLDFDEAKAWHFAANNNCTLVVGGNEFNVNVK